MAFRTPPIDHRSQAFMGLKYICFQSILFKSAMIGGHTAIAYTPLMYQATLGNSHKIAATLLPEMQSFINAQVLNYTGLFILNSLAC